MKIVTRSEAVRLGLAWYFTGKPCKRGHIARRPTKAKFCSECNRLKVAEWVAKNKERKASADKAYAAKNAEKVRAYKEQHYAKNSGHIKSKTRAWRLNNYDRAREIERNKLAQRRNAPGAHTTGDIQHLFKHQRGRCPICRDLLGKYHVDHVVPLSRSGTNERSNLQLLCVACNQQKHAKDPIVFMQQKGFLI